MGWCGNPAKFAGGGGRLHRGRTRRRLRLGALPDRAAAGPRPLRECCEIMLQTAKALSAAWMRLILHRNLKPENILVSPRGEVKVADFGLFVEPTPYWSPERKAGRSPDLRGDLFALGTIF